MSASVRISRKSARAVLEFFHEDSMPPPFVAPAVLKLRAALKSKPKKAFVSAPTRKQTKAEKKKTKKEKRQGVREAVFDRAGGDCECGCGREFTDYDPGELDHFRGRARAESVGSCWALSKTCHREKTLNIPGAMTWLQRFWTHCEKHGYAAEVRELKKLLAKHQAQAEFLRRSFMADEAVASAEPAGAKNG